MVSILRVVIPAPPQQSFIPFIAVEHIFKDDEKGAWKQ
jgi:hypothetical protein